MKFIHLLPLLLLLLLASCAPLGSSIAIEEQTLTSTYPPYAVSFKKGIRKVAENGPNRAILLDVPEKKHIELGSYRWTGPTTGIDYYYSLAGLAAEINFHYLDEVHFSGHKWARIVNYDEKNEKLYCCYFTRKDHAIIFVGLVDFNLNPEPNAAYKKYKKSQKLSEIALRDIDEQFKYLDSVAEILY